MEDSTKERDSPSVINSAEIVEELGNMFIVKVDDELKQVPANYKNELLYKHKLYQLLHPDTED